MLIHQGLTDCIAIAYNHRMNRPDLRKALKRKRGLMTRAAKTIGISKQHLSNCLAGNGELSLVAALRLVDFCRSEGLKVTVKDLAPAPQQPQA